VAIDEIAFNRNEAEVDMEVRLFALNCY